jgi:hypothetical protein
MQATMPAPARAVERVALRYRLLLTSPFTVMAVVMLLYELWLGMHLPNSHHAWNFADPGRNFLHESHVSAAIKTDSATERSLSAVGYDGQFVLYIALDPAHARYYMDNAAYRYTRILYPMLARWIALGTASLIPYALVLINLLAVGGGTLAVAAWLKRKKLSPWFALLYGLYPGLFISIQSDLTEPLSYALVALAVYLFDFGGRHRYIWAAVSFALAVLARESAIVFPALYGLSLAVDRSGAATRPAITPRSVGRACAFLVIVVTPMAVYKLFLLHWLGYLGTPGGLFPRLIPFQGLLSYYPWDAERLEEIRSVVLPSLVCGGVALWALRKRHYNVEVLCLLANVLLFVALLNPSSYAEMRALGRITTGVILAALYCLPAFDRVLHRQRAWLWLSAALCLPLTLFWLVFPVAEALILAARQAAVLG